jgi:hypothetical protein
MPYAAFHPDTVGVTKPTADGLREQPFEKIAVITISPQLLPTTH